MAAWTGVVVLDRWLWVVERVVDEEWAELMVGVVMSGGRGGGAGLVESGGSGGVWSVRRRIGEEVVAYGWMVERWW